MKKSLVILTLILVLAISACMAQTKENKSDNGITWYTNLEEAQTVAQEKEVPIFIHFTGSDWCGWCMKLDEEVYSKKVFQDYVAENLVMVVIDFPKKIKQSSETKAYNESLARKYGIRGFPTVQLLKPDGTPIAQTGYQYGGAEKYIEHLEELLNK